MFAFIFLLLLQFSHPTWMGVIFVTEAVVVMLEFWSDWDSAVSPLNAPQHTHVPNINKELEFHDFHREEM
jgi:hypothetical protein